MKSRSDGLDPSPGGSGPQDTRSALLGALGHVLQVIADPSASHSSMLVALSDLWVAEAALEKMLADEG